MNASATEKVAIVVPVYNGTRYIAKTVDTLLAQTFRDFELILVDDGSNDGSLEMLMRLSRDDPRIRVFSKSNGGIASARNYGISNSSAPLIAFCDQDDLWEPRKLELQAPLFEDEDVGLCYTDTLGRASLPADSERRLNMPEGWVFDELLAWNFISSCSVIVRRSALEAFGGFDEDRDLMGVDDWHCWLEVALRYRLGRVPEALCTHVVHEGNYSKNYLKMTEAEMVCMDKISASAEKLGVSRDWPSLRRSILDSRARLCVTKGRFREGAMLFERASKEDSSASLYLRQVFFQYSPVFFLHALQSLKRRLRPRRAQE